MKSSNKHKLAIPLLYCVWCFSLFADPPIPSDLGSILGYPSTEILVTDVTDVERKTWSIKTGKERRAGVNAAPPSEKLIAAYRIVGKAPNTFYPILISFAEPGTFLTDNIKQLFDKLSSANSPLAKGGGGPYGPFVVDGVGEGGIYIGNIKVPSKIKEMNEAGEDIALISILALPTQKLEMRIAILANLDQGLELAAAQGGSRYFNAFRSNKDGATTPRYDEQSLFRKLNLLALKSAPSRSVQTQSPPSGSLRTGEHVRHTPEVNEAAQVPQNVTSSTGDKPPVWPWFAGIAALLAAVALILKRRTDKPH